MTILPAVQAELPRYRAEAEALMVDAGTARRATGETAYVDGVDGAEYGDLFTSRCKVQSRNLQVRDVEVGARTALSVRTELHLPVAAQPLVAGDLFEVTTAHALSTVVEGTVFRVLGPVGKTLATASRYEVEIVNPYVAGAVV